MDAIVLEDSKGRKMSDEEFERFCQDNPNLRIERNSNLETTISPLKPPISGVYGAEVIRQLSDWNLAARKGVVFGLAGFTLIDQSILLADVSWMSNEKWQTVSEEDRDRFSRVCPQFVIQIRSPGESVKKLKSKMELWIKNGAELAWLIDPFNKNYSIYRPSPKNAARELSEGRVIIIGTGPVEGFQLDLTTLGF
jgi:Uma2 family endonuclease